MEVVRRSETYYAPRLEMKSEGRLPLAVLGNRADFRNFGFPGVTVEFMNQGQITEY